MGEFSALVTPAAARADATPSVRTLQRRCACGGKCESCEKSKRLQRTPSRFGNVQEAPSVVDDVSHLPGTPLESSPRTFVEPRSCHDFVRVRVHSGAAARQPAAEVNASAYRAVPNTTVGAERVAAPGMQLGADRAHLGKSNAKHGVPTSTEERHINAGLATLRSQEAGQVALLQGPKDAVGMPSNLMSGLEHLAGVDLSAVRIHYNSSRPAQLNALAYTYGTDIQIAPGQEKHLPHEGWHVVQQLQGRVKPTMQVKGMLANDNEGLEREADVMGAKARLLGNQTKTSAFHARLAAAAGADSDDEPFMVAMAPGGHRGAGQLARPTMRGSDVPVIQRVASFVAGTVSATTNLAAHVIAGRRDMGFTPPTLNGTAALSAAAAQGAIKAPGLGGMSNTDGTESTWVSTVPTNEASFTMQLPSAGPWSTVTPKATVAALFTNLGLTAQAGCSSAGNSTFSFNGKPTDAAFAANVRTHENLHAADHKAGFNAVIVPWDTKLEAAKTANTKFKGATVAAAEAALYAAMGGTPNQIATDQFNKWIALNNTTHAGATLATGATATASNAAANATCTTSSLDAT